MEKYGDLITNGLDLLSFLLVTPELLRFVRPVVEWMSRILLSAVFVAALIIGRRYWDLSGTWSHAPLWRLAVEGVVLGIVLVIASKYWRDDPLAHVIGRLSVDASRHLFALGVAIFFISRLIAFYGSALKAGLLSSAG